MEALLVVSFGTTHERAIEGNIGAVERALGEAFPEALVKRAFTSCIVRKRLAAAGIEVPDVMGACESLLEQDVRDVVVVPTHLLPGWEHDRVMATLEPFRTRFDSLRVTRTLLHDHDDFRAVIKAVRDTAGCEEGEALVLMGHGTDHFAGVAYAAIAYEIERMGLDDVFVGCVEGYPGFDDCLRAVQGAGFENVLLTPLMLVAGGHAMNDMAGDGEDSWRSRFEAAGLNVRCLVRGLGEIPAVQQLYCSHVA